MYDPGLRKIFMDEYAMPEGQVDNLFGIEKSTKATEYDLAISGIVTGKQIGRAHV